MTSARSLPIPDVAPGEHILEQDFQEQLRRHTNAPGRNTRIARQNAGGVITRNRAGKAIGRFQAGPAPGAADLSGIATITVRGVNLGLRLEVEVKVDHVWSDEQKTYAAYVRSMGALYVLIRYDHAMTLAANVAAGVAQIDAAVAAVAASISP